MSNTEMASVPLELLKRCVQPVCESEDWDKLRHIAANPAEQPQGEPAAWLYKGTTTGDMLSLTRKEDHFECKYSDYGEYVKGEPLYTHADPGGVERLREEVRLLKLERAGRAGAIAGHQEARYEAEEERDTLRAQLADWDALLREIHDGTLSGYQRWVKIEQALPASAEPSAPKCETCHDLGEVHSGEMAYQGYNQPPEPVERDERAAITMGQVLRAHDYADSHPHKYLRGTSNWCAAVAHSLNEQARAALERKP